jgi:FKBP-type peptidyl-prolyl cis-trans isomerase
MNSLLRPSTLALALLASVSATPVVAADPSLKTEKDRHSYMIGMMYGRQLQEVKDDVDLAMLQKGLADTLTGAPTLLSEEEMQQAFREFNEKVQAARAERQQKAAAENLKKGEEFLAKNKTAKGVKTTESGLQYLVIKEGAGPKPKVNDQVKVHYVGTTIDGKKFDSSIDRGQPATFPLNGVIAGWTEALQLMPVGSKYKLFIPSKLAYGERGSPPNIGPNEVLIFEVELLEILN